MIRLIWQGVRFARGRAVALAAGMLVAAVAFSLLTASVAVNAATIEGDVAANWRGAYDLLVLPSGSAQSAGDRHLVQVNYLSSSYGGITAAQYARVTRLPGVGVAAPLAILGYILATAYVPVHLSAAAIGASGARVLTVTSRYTADQGLSRYPARAEGYVYITPNRLTFNPSGLSPYGNDTEHMPGGHDITVCPVPPTTSGQPSPFTPSAALVNYGSCFYRAGSGIKAPVRSLQSFLPPAEVVWPFPVLLAGIDPVAEDKLTGLGRAVTSGRYLLARDGPRPSGGIPVIASSASFSGDTDRVTVNLLPAPAVSVARSGDPLRIARVLGAEHGTPVGQATITGEQAWHSVLNQNTSSYAYDLAQFWTVSPVRFSPAPDGQLKPVTVRNPDSVWQDTANTGSFGAGYVTAPRAAADTGYRSLTERAVGNDPTIPGISIQSVGTFDPARLAGFSGGGPGSPLASYRSPVLTGADAASRALLHGQPLLPDGNMAGYAQQPPLLYTTLSGVHAIEQGAALAGPSYAAPIGSIRVRVTGLRGTVREQLGKIAAVGQEIRAATGLQVIITAGASPHRVTIALPAGQFGRPALRLAENWTETGIVLVVLRQADRESVALFVLILIVCGLFLAGAALAGVRGRRTEIGALRAVGWGRHQVARVVLGEVVLLGVLAGLAGAALSALLISGLGLHLPLWRALLVLPVAAVLATLAGLAPALVAARIQPAEALAPAARAPRRGGLRVGSVTGLAVAGVARVPGRCLLAGAGLAVGVAGLAVLLAAHASFTTSIGDSTLAGLVNASTRGTELLAVLLTIGLSAVGVADLTFLNTRERAGELAALAASGWGRWQLGRLLATEALVTALGGAASGAGAGLGIAGHAFGLSAPVAEASAAAGCGGLAVTLAAAIGVLAITVRRPLASVLAADE